MFKYLFSILKYLFETIVNIFIKKTENISNNKIREWWQNTRIYGFIKRYDSFDIVRANQKIFDTFILLSNSSADQTKTKYQKKSFSIHHKLYKSIVSEMECWVVIKANTNSPKEREIIDELLLVDSSNTVSDFSKKRLKTIGKERLKSCKHYIKALREYQKIPIENYQLAKLNYLNDYVKSTKSYYKLLYIYLPIEQRNILEKPFSLLTLN